jgi:7,8-dihydropterin-6-yl-methyl-4-(beta-D-ribofuranosyl)aminobenzene 5'-phosphate synthase
MLTALLLLALAAPPAEIRILYDNTSAQANVQADWGFAALVSSGEYRILFDTGTKPDVFMKNLEALGVDPATLECVVISHNHGDHTGGLAPLRARNPGIKVYMPSRKGPFAVAPGVWSTGIIDGPVPEQALVVRTGKGFAMVTGCSHPGIAKMAEVAEKQRGADSLTLLVGGFHMINQSPDQIRDTIARLQKLKVERIVPTHCTGDAAIALFRAAFGERFEAGGAGRLLTAE